MMLIVYLIGIIGAIAAVTGVIHSHDSKVKDARDAYWKPQLEQQTAATNMAVQASNTNLATIHAISSQAQQCSKGTTDLESASAKARAIAAANLKAKEGQLADAETDRLKYAEMAGQLEQAGATCEQKLGIVRDTLTGIGLIRMRDHPSSGNDGRSPAAGPDSGSGTLRVSP